MQLVLSHHQARLLHGGVRPVETTIGSYLETLEAEELKVNSLARLIDGGRKSSCYMLDSAVQTYLRYPCNRDSPGNWSGRYI